ncbi:MAG: type II secretion system F family protein [Lentisphaerae bacterium]|nr:type II secretion system F family protein [Lentisphaerota bacterium]
MPQFSYKALRKDGQRTTGTVDAPDRMAAMAAVERMGLVPISVTEGSTPTRSGGIKRFRLATSDRMNSRQVLFFSEELSDLLAAGMPLGSALNCLASHGKEGPSGKIAAELRDRIIRGESFSDALAAHNDSFPPLYSNMIRAGEASGALPQVLLRLVEHYERLLSMREKIIAALVYPVIVLVFGLITVIFSMVKIIPQFTKMFEQMGQSLPASTKLLLNMSDFMVRYGLFVAIGLFFVAVLFTRHIHTPKGRLWWDGVKLHTPLIKGIIASGVFANFAYTLQTLLANGVHILQALRITEQTVGNSLIARELAHARERVTDGTTISGPLAAGKIFPEVMTDMLSVGEQTGDMPTALGHIGRRFETELDRNIKILTNALEPIMIVMVAVGVGFVAVSILSAVFQATGSLGIS